MAQYTLSKKVSEDTRSTHKDVYLSSSRKRLSVFCLAQDRRHSVTRSPYVTKNPNDLGSIQVKETAQKERLQITTRQSSQILPSQYFDTILQHIAMKCSKPVS